MKNEGLSIVMTTYNGQRTLEKCLSLFFSQDYLEDNRKGVEFIIMDGGSTDKTLEIIKKYQKNHPGIIKLFNNPKKQKIGKGAGADLGTKKAKGKFLLLIDQDNLLIQKEWLGKMIDILIRNPEISCVQSRMVVPEKGNLTEKYLGAIGIEDPFAVPYCLNSQITLNPKRFRYNKKEEYYEYLINKDNFFYAGDNGFLIRKKDFDENKGYTQDIDNFYRMALSGKKYKVAVPKNLRIFHHTSSSFIDMIKKRGYYVRFYLLKNIQNRDFYWFNLEKNTLKQNLKFLENILFNLLIFPSIIDGISMSIKEKKVFWLVHPFMMFAITMNYLLSFSYAKIFKKI